MKYTALTIAALAALSTLGFAQTKKPASTQVKPKPENKATKGTVQLAGDNGKLNTTYTLGKVDPINITVTDVRFSVVREIVGKDVLAPAKDEKLMVVDFTVHNPNPKAIQFSGGSIKFTGEYRSGGLVHPIGAPATAWELYRRTAPQSRCEVRPSERACVLY